MISSRNSDDDFAERREDRDREISLGTPTILAIFFAIALVCALFFGFGYTLGRHSAQVLAQIPEVTGVPRLGGAKPAPGSPALRPAPPQGESPSADPTSEPPENIGSATDASPARPTQDKARAAASTAAEPHPSASQAAPRQPATPPLAAPATPGAPTIVQVTALTRQDDADNLVAALKKRGYDVVIRHEAQDKLLHVQIGPMPSKKDAELVRQRLLADGYHAILKDPVGASPQAAPRP